MWTKEKLSVVQADKGGPIPIVSPTIFQRRKCILHNQGNTVVFTGSETVKNWPIFRQPITPFFCVFENQLDDRSELR